MILARVEKILLFSIVFFLPTQLGKHFWPDFSSVYSLRIDYLSPTIFFWDLILVLNLGVFVLLRRRINKVALNLCFFFILTQLLSILYNSLTSDQFSIGTSLVRLEQFLLVGFFGVYLSSLNLKNYSKTIFWGLGLSILLQSILAIGQFLNGSTLGFWILGERTFSISTPAIAKFDFYGSQFLRPYATFPHPNVLAAFLVIATILMFLFRQTEKKYLSLVVACLSITALVLTVSRTAIAAAALSSFFLLSKRWFILIVAVLLLSSPFLYPRFSSVLNVDSLSVLRREELSRFALNLWLSSPIFGVGLNNFITSSSENLLIGPSRFLQPVHNIFLLSLSETGLLGFLGLAVLLGYPMIKIFKHKALIICWAIIIFLGLFDHYFLTLPQGYRLLFLVWGISNSMLELNNEKSA